MKYKPSSLNYAINLVRQEFKGFIKPDINTGKETIKLTQIKDKK